MDHLRPLVLITIRTMSVYYVLLAAASLVTLFVEIETNDKATIWILVAGAIFVMIGVTETVRYLFKRFVRTGWCVATAFVLLQACVFVYILVTFALPTLRPTPFDVAIVLLVIPICVLLTAIVALLHPATIRETFSPEDAAA
jgi:hypothetical protein